MAWSFAFLLKAVFSFISLSIAFDPTVVNSLGKLIVIILTNVLTDIGPCIAVLELKFIEIFKQVKHKVSQKQKDFEDVDNEIFDSMAEEIHKLDE